MTAAHEVRRRWSWGFVAAAAVIGLAGCTTGRSPEGAAPSVPTGSGATVAVPTVVETAQGTWVSLPMGHLDDPLNTFWQLLYRPVAGTSWTDQVEATATATNGGIAFAARASGPFIVGVRPSDRLVFSPLIATSDGGRTWQNGLLPDGLADVSDAIAAGAAQTIAVVTARSQTEILTSGASLSQWQPLTTEAALAATPAGRACGLTSITAVAYDVMTPVIGAVCSHNGAPSVFALAHGTWQPDGPAVDRVGGTGTTTLQLQNRDGTLSGLFATTQPGGATSVTAGWSEDIGQHWQTSPAVELPSGEGLTSYGPAGPDGLYILASGSGGRQTLYVIDNPAGSWLGLPSPPAGTQAVVVDETGSIQALTVDSATLTVWSLSSASSRWVNGQVMDVAIDYGSSS